MYIFQITEQKLVQYSEKRAKLLQSTSNKHFFSRTLDMDDFNGKFCKNGTFPIIRSVSDCFKGAVPTTVEQQTSTTTTEEDEEWSTTTTRMRSRSSRIRRTTTTTTRSLNDEDEQYADAEESVDLKEDIEFTQDDMEYYDNYDDQSGEEESSRGSSIFIFGTVFFSTINLFFFLLVVSSLFFV
jgi:hypothetical protein